MVRMLSKWIAITALCGVLLLTVVWQGASQAYESISRNTPSTFSLGGPVGRLSPINNDRECSTFSSRKDAQRFFRAHRPDRDPHLLDTRYSESGKPIRNGKACEEFAY